MKSNVFNIVLRLIVASIIVAIIWNPLLTLTYVFSQGQDPRFDMGDDYEIWNWPGSIIRWQSKDKFEFTWIIQYERVIEFSLKDPWLMGKTEKGWFAINKKTHQLFYPYSSKNELQDVIGLDMSSLNFLTNPKPYEIIYPWTKKSLLTIKISLILLPILIAFAPNILRYLSKKIRKKNRAGEIV